MDTKQVSAALVKAQRAFGPALKDKTNPAFRSKYADLGACLDAVMDALNENGIALMQRMHPHDGGVCVETIFIHETGEQLSAGMLSVPATKQDAQGYGSAMTYARRYSVMAACGIAPEDDDGNAAKKPLGASPAAEVKPAAKAARSESGSAPQIILNSLPPDWQAWLGDFARDVTNTFTSSGVIAAQQLIDDTTAAEQLGPEHITGLYALLDSKCRSALKTLPRAANQVTA
jgi:hypothetical protein